MRSLRPAIEWQMSAKTNDKMNRRERGALGLDPAPVARFGSRNWLCQLQLAQDGSIRPQCVGNVALIGLRLSRLERVNCRPTCAHHEPNGERPCLQLPCLAAFTVPVTGASWSI
jgi:hypothetical protein